MKAITIRKIPAELSRTIQKKAKEKNTSINKAVIEILEEINGGKAKPRKELYLDLDFLSGSWSKDESKGFEKALGLQREIDQEMW
jgi:hypothetical protein